MPRGIAMGTAVRCVLVLWAACPAAAFSCGVLPARPHAAVRPAALVVMADKNDETKGAVAGVVLGGLLAGPFGALWGAQIGGAMGANNRAKREQGDQLAAMGLDEEVLKLAKQTAMELEEAETSLAIVKGAENSQRSLIETLDRTMQEAYTAAEAHCEAATRRRRAHVSRSDRQRRPSGRWRSQTWRRRRNASRACRPAWPPWPSERARSSRRSRAPSWPRAPTRAAASHRRRRTRSRSAFGSFDA